jgi:hypothetical protein
MNEFNQTEMESKVKQEHLREMKYPSREQLMAEVAVLTELVRVLSDRITELEVEFGNKIKAAVLAEREECALLCEEERIDAVHYSAPTQSNWLAKKIRAK